MKSITELWAEMNFTYYGRHTNSFGVVLDSWMSDQIMVYELFPIPYTIFGLNKISLLLIKQRNYSSQVLWLTQIMYMASRNIGDGKKIPYPYSIKQFVVTTVSDLSWQGKQSTTKNYLHCNVTTGEGKKLHISDGTESIGYENKATSKCVQRGNLL